MDSGACRAIVPMLISAAGGTIATYAMIDSGATHSAILIDLAKKIGAKIQKSQCKLTTFGSTVYQELEFTSFRVNPLNKKFSFQDSLVEKALVGDNLTTMNETPPSNHDIANIPFLHDVKFDELEDKTVGVVLDVKFAWTYLKGQEVRFANNSETFAVNSEFGWTLIGPSLKKTKDKYESNCELCPLDINDLSLKQEIDLMFKHDFLLRGDDAAPHEETHPSNPNERIS